MDNLLKYLEENQNSGGPVDKVHDALLHRIASHPHLVGIRNQKYTFREVALRGEKTLSGCADLIIIDKDKELYIVEVKMLRGDIKSLGDMKRDINKQLRREYHYFKENLGVLAHMIGACSHVDRAGFDSYSLPRPIEDLIKSCS